MGNKINICFVCTGNACRSQMAEGFAKKLGDDKVEIHSAGSHPLGHIVPKTIEVMREAGIDISKQRSKSIEEVPLEAMDYVITLCDSAANYCPSIAGKGNKLHWPFPDPFAATEHQEPANTKAFREVRDAIREKIESWLKEIL